MSASDTDAKRHVAGPILVLAGVALAFAAWLLPVNLKSVSPAILKAAGENTQTLSQFGMGLVDNEKIGPAAIVLAASKAAGDPGSAQLETALSGLEARDANSVAWGGWDPFLDPLFHLKAPSGHTTSTPVLTFFISEHARTALLSYLSTSGLVGVQDLLKTRDIGVTGRFIPANKPGGQPLDALILLTAMLDQSRYLRPSLQQELRGMAETAIAQKDLGELGSFFLDLLSLGRRLDWTQLSELLHHTDSARSVGEYAQLARVAPDQFDLIYAAALFTDSSDRVASYLLQFGKAGADDLKMALGMGQGAVQQLMLRQVPINRSKAPALSRAATLILAHPELMLAVKYLGYLIGLFLLLRGLDRSMISPGGPAASAPPVRVGILAVLMAALLVVATEPFLLKAASSSDYRVHIHLPMLAATGTPPASPTQPSLPTMNSSTVISIGIFALVQVLMYFICLKKINQIAKTDISPRLKLRLMENEENLFDSGLYVGMMGTAAALVLQVLGVIEPNLLAAYSSNLFGIVCVAVVKIRHVRGFKRQLILENEAEGKVIA